MKVIKRLLTFILGKEEDFSLEEKLALSYIFYSSVICFISIFGNIGIGLGIKPTAIVIVSFVIYSIVFILGRFYKKINFAKWFFSIFTLIFCDLYWYLNYGSKGSAMYIFPVYYSVMIFVWNNAQIKLFTALILVNILALFASELINPTIIPSYPSEPSRIIDTYLGLLIFLGALSTLVLSAKNNYIKQFKRAQQSDKLKSAFLANMSHEIRTPLNAIMGFTKLFTTRDLSKEKKVQYSQLITDNSKYLMQLLSDILDISMIESGQLKTNVMKFNLLDLFNRLQYTHNHILKENGKQDVNLFLDVPNSPVIIESDEVRLEQVMSNLINNAIKFTSEGYIKFGYVSYEKYILFYVEDTGIGIKEEFQPEIFNRFVKNEDNRDINFVRGAGIGLSLTKELVQILGGKIWFTSAYQEGSTFFITLPQKTNLLG